MRITDDGSRGGGLLLARRALRSDLIRQGKGYLERVPFSPLGDVPQTSAHTRQDMCHPSHDSHFRGPHTSLVLDRGVSGSPFPWNSTLNPGSPEAQHGSSLTGRSSGLLT